MTSDRDIYRSAKLLIDQHGDHGALIHVAMRIDELADAGDFEGQQVWRRIRRAICDLVREREPDDTLQ